MEELYSIMRELLEVEYHQKSLLYIAQLLEAAYDSEECGRTELIVNGISYYLTVLHKDLETVIGRLDSYIAETAKKDKTNY